MCTRQPSKMPNRCLPHFLPLELHRCTFALGKILCLFEFVYWTWCVIDVESLLWRCFEPSTLIEISMRGKGRSGTQENARLELVVMRVTFRMFPPSIVWDQHCLFPSASRRNWLLSKETQPQDREFTMEQFGARPNSLLEMRGRLMQGPVPRHSPQGFIRGSPCFPIAPALVISPTICIILSDWVHDISGW